MRTLTYTAPGCAGITFGGPDYAITMLDGISSPEFVAQEKAAPFQDGSTYIDGLYSPRDITLEGAIVAYSGRDAARRAILTELNPKRGVGTLVYTNSVTSYQIAAIPITSPTFKDKTAEDPYQRFQIIFHAPDPFWQHITGESDTLTYAGTALEFPALGVEIPVGGIEISTVGTINGQSIIINNSGDVPCPLCVKFYGETVNPKILNVTTGEYIRIVKTIALGDYVEVCTGFGSKTVEISESGSVTNATMYLDLLSTFFQLAVGNNEIRFIDEGAAAGSSAVLTYRFRYIGA